MPRSYRRRTTPQPGSITYPFPVRQNFTAQFVLPRDMTLLEARRLQAFLLAAAVPAGWHRRVARVYEVRP